MTDRTPAQVEAEGDETVDLEWLGHTISVPAAAEDWDINVTRAFARNDLIAAIEGLVGKAEFAKIERAHRAAHDGKFRNADLKPLGDKIAELYGFAEAGE